VRSSDLDRWPSACVKTSDQGNFTRDALLVLFFKDKKNPYFWSGCDSLVEFSSEEAKSIRKQAKKKMASGLEAALKEADNGKRGQRRYLTVCIQVSDRERYLPYKHCRCDADRTVVSRSYLTGGLASNLDSCGGRVRRLP